MMITIGQKDRGCPDEGSWAIVFLNKMEDGGCCIESVPISHTGSQHPSIRHIFMRLYIWWAYTWRKVHEFVGLKNARFRKLFYTRRAISLPRLYFHPAIPHIFLSIRYIRSAKRFWPVPLLAYIPPHPYTGCRFGTVEIHSLEKR